MRSASSCAIVIFLWVPGVKFDTGYNRRCIVKSVFNSIKHRRINVLRNKLSNMKKREIAWYIIIYNLEIIQKIRILILWILKIPFRTAVR